MRFPAMSDSPLDRLETLDLGTTAGLALLRRLDARLHRQPDPAALREGLARLTCRVPLAERAAGLLVLPGGALALRREALLLPDAASALVLGPQPAAALRAALEELPGVVSVDHGPAGLQARAGPPLGPPMGPPMGTPMEEADGAAAQAVSLLPQPGGLARWSAAAAGWRGPALLRWSAAGAVAWEMVPAPPALALAASVVGEALDPALPPVPAAVWDAPSGDERYQLLSSGLAAHLDDLLAQEVSDRLRYALIDLWTDGEDSLASRLADRLGALPACFATPFGRPAGLTLLQAWPRGQRAAGAAWALFGIAPDLWQARWQGPARLGFLAAARRLLPAGTVLLGEARGAEPLPMEGLEADRRLRAGAGAAALLAPAPETPQALLFLGHRLAQLCAAPVLAAMPGWGLCHLFDPDGRAQGGNGAWYGFLPGAEAARS